MTKYPTHLTSMCGGPPVTVKQSASFNICLLGQERALSDVSGADWPIGGKTSSAIDAHVPRLVHVIKSKEEHALCTPDGAEPWVDGLHMQMTCHKKGSLE